MLNLSNQELQAAIAQLDQAIYNHDQWRKGVLRVLIGRLPPDPVDLAPDASGRCRFGQWYESEEAGALHEHPAFLALGEAHRQIHESAARLLRRSADGLEVPINEYDQFTNALDRMRLEIESLRGALADTAQNRDPLTGARNRASLLADLREQQALVRRGVQECALVMLDLDRFKAVNDGHGHRAGDAVLRGAAQRLLADLRPYDRLYRYGGEEFLVMMPQVDLTGAVAAAERMRAGLATRPIPAGENGSPLAVTASFGVVALSGESPVEESIDRADQALYQAKAAGRDRVEAAPSGPE